MSFSIVTRQLNVGLFYYGCLRRLGVGL